jgi:hypothetical protein
MIIFVFFNFLAFWPFPWQWQPFWKNQPLTAQLHMAYDIPTRFHKVWSRHLWEIERTKMCGRIIRIIIIVKKKRRIAIHHPDCITVKETTARQKRGEKNFGEYVCVRTQQSGDRTLWGEFWLFCTCPCQSTWRSSFFSQ